MSTFLKDDSLLNFGFLTASFYNYVKSAGNIFKNIKSKYDTIQTDKNENKNNKILNIEKDFDSLNSTNLMNYFEEISLLNENQPNVKKNKMQLIKSVFGNTVECSQPKKIFFTFTEKINSSMLSDKYLLVKFLSGQIIDFVFHIYDLFYNIIKNMEEKHDKNIQDLTSKNLIEEDELLTSKKKLAKEIIDLKNIIETKNQNIDNNMKSQEKLERINKSLENDIIKMKRDINEMKKAFTDSKDKSKEKIISLNKELKEFRHKITLLDTELKEANKKKEFELNEFRQKIILLDTELNETKEKKEYELNEFRQKITFLNTELNETKEKKEYELNEFRQKIILLDTELKKSNEAKEYETKESKKKIESLNNNIKELEKNSLTTQKEIDELKKSNMELNKKIECLFAKKERAEEGYTFMKNLNIQIIIDSITPKEENLKNQQQTNTQNNGLIRMINLISKENEILNNKLIEKNNELEKIRKNENKKLNELEKDSIPLQFKFFENIAKNKVTDEIVKIYPFNKIQENAQYLIIVTKESYLNLYIQKKLIMMMANNDNKIIKEIKTKFTKIFDMKYYSDSDKKEYLYEAGEYLYKGNFFLTNTISELLVLIFKIIIMNNLLLI